MPARPGGRRPAPAKDRVEHAARAPARRRAGDPAVVGAARCVATLAPAAGTAGGADRWRL